MSAQPGFVSDLVGNPKDRFSHNEAHILSEPGFFFIFLLFFMHILNQRCRSAAQLISTFVFTTPYFLNPNFSASRVKKEVSVFSVTSPKNRVGRPLLNFFF